MSFFYRHVLRPALFSLDAERAHHLVFSILKKLDSAPFDKVASRWARVKNAKLEQNILGINFPNPVGLAAGFDKNAELIGGLDKAGFGFAEVGSITAHSSLGNPSPRMFRLPDDQALINRMGLNNEGAEAVARRIGQTKRQIPLGINIAKTHDPSILGDAALADYELSYGILAPFADYLTLNISCPNTQEGKTFEEKATLRALLKTLQNCNVERHPPLLVKFSVDIKTSHLNALVDLCLEHHIAGFVATNTSNSRPHLRTPTSKLTQIGNGGLSGRPIARRSNEIISQIRERVPLDMPIIGVGGVDSPQAVVDKLVAGADLIQVYTGLVYEGPALIRRINTHLLELMNLRNVANLPDLIRLLRA